VIAKKYGNKIHSVQPNFDARAMNEVGFTRDHDWSMDAQEFSETYEQVEKHELTAAAEGEIQGEAEETLLTSLQDQLVAVSKAANDGVVLVLSEQGVDYPKTRHTQTTRVVDGANRLYFRFSVEPPLRVAVYRKRS
jgi:chromosome condensin MukBEF complex kleisin-like MukF subunit